jgi:alpha-galactosidase
MTVEELPYGAKVPMEPMGLTVCYEDAESGDICTEERDEFESFSDDSIAFEATYDGEVIELAVTPQRAVRMKQAQLSLRHAFASEEWVLLNGYQSWTDTAERHTWSSMRLMPRAFRAVAKRYAIDGGGDYDAVEYSALRGVRHGFTYATFRRDEGMVLVASLSEDNGFTFIRTHANEGRVTLETEPPVRVLQVGERVVLGRYAIIRGTEGDCYDRWFGLAGVSARPVRPLVGYTSWYRHYGEIDEEKLMHDLEGMKDAPFVVRPGEPRQDVHLLFQIDDGYCKVGDWLDVDAKKFPNGLASLAEAAREAGFLPGLWLAPFVCERDSRIFRECDDWLLHDEQGEPVRTGPHWSDGFALDTRNVEVRSYIIDVLHTITQEWGFKLLKTDFLYAACMRPRNGLNRGQLMADALDLLRKGAGEDALILGCGVPLAPAFGRVDYCRIGCDVGLNWNAFGFMHMLNRERVSTKNSLENTRGRAPLDGRAFGNDPDVFFLRKDVKLSQSQRDELLFTAADCGSVLLTSDDMGAWSESDRARYAEALRIFLARHAERHVRSGNHAR